MATEMDTIRSVYGFSYHGEREGWFIAAGYWEAGDTRTYLLDMSNIVEMCEQFRSASAINGEDYAIETFGGAFGKGGYLLVRPGSIAETVARKLRAMLEDYPVLNDDDFGDREWDAGYETILDWARSEYPNLHAETLAAAFAEACDSVSEYVDCWPNRDGYDRDYIAAALRKARHSRAA